MSESVLIPLSADFAQVRLPDFPMSLDESRPVNK